MTEKEFARTANVLYAGACGIASMLYGFFFIIIEMCIFQMAKGDILSKTAQRTISLPREFFIAYGWIFAILLIVEWFFYEDYRDELRKIKEELEEDPEFDLRFTEDCILDGLDALSSVVRPRYRSSDAGKELIRRCWVPEFLQQLRWNIRKSALYRGVHIPAGDRYVFLFLVVPLLISSLIFTSQVTGAGQRQADLEEHTRAYIEQLAEQVEPYCETLSWDTLRGQDLAETEDGIFFHAEFGEEYCPSPCSIHLEFDEYCRVMEMTIQIGIDPDFTRQEILDHTQKYLDQLFPLFEKGNLATRDAYFEEMGVLPREFRETFLNSDYYPSIYYHELEKHPQIDFKYLTDENGNVAEGSYMELTLYRFG